MQIGPTIPAGMGPGCITWSEIDSWQRRTRIPLTPGESILLRTLSREYISELLAAEDPDRPMPHLTDFNKRLTKVLNARAVRKSMRQTAALRKGTP